MSNSRLACRAFTLVEVLISLTLLGILFTLLGGLLGGMSKIARLADDDSVRNRQMNFCFELIRKELGEMIVDQGRLDFNFIGGENFVGYTTTRPELLVKNSIPGGARRVEWRYDAAEKTMTRSATMLIDGKREAAPPVRTTFLEGLAGFEVYYFDGVQWLRMTGISELVPQTLAIAVRFIFDSPDSDNKQQFFESAFLLPNETFVKK